MQTNFADAIININININITVTGPLVRLDLGTVLSQTKDGKQELLATPTQQLVMPLDGFLRLPARLRHAEDRGREAHLRRRDQGPAGPLPHRALKALIRLQGRGGSHRRGAPIACPARGRSAVVRVHHGRAR